MLDLCMRAKVLTAKEALNLGIATQVVDLSELETAVENLVNEIKEQSPSAIRLGLQAYEELASVPKEEEHKYLHKMLMQVLTSKDAKEGLLAFREKRKAVWTGE